MSSTRRIFLWIALPLVIFFAGLAIVLTNKQPSNTGSETATTSEDCRFAESPTDISQATSILYPGQTRGGDYKPHGGFRFDNATTNEITVKAPLEATVTAGSRYIEQGEVQYLFDFKTNCGLEYRFDHLKTLSAKLQAAADQLPEAKVDDSRTSSIKNVTVTTGETIATAVGFTKGVEDSSRPNVSFDFGVYDRRQKNAATADATWAAAHEAEQHQAWYAVCWFDLLPTEDAAAIKILPAVGDKTSDYCL